jgi:3-deoxy-D-manno-octulosonate 8-phosphate phosphatase (KDO 8-P phosphatase)
MAGIKLLLMDCDGVLADGRLFFSAAGEAMKVFDVQDGQGLALWHRAGFKSGIISGRNAREIIQRRADDLGVEFVYTSSNDKVADFEKILAAAGVTAEETAYVGDDVADIELMKRVGLPIAVKNAMPEVKAAAEYVTKKKGGRGAIREVVDMLLRERQ